MANISLFLRSDYHLHRLYPPRRTVVLPAQTRFGHSQRHDPRLLPHLHAPPNRSLLRRGPRHNAPSPRWGKRDAEIRLLLAGLCVPGVSHPGLDQVI